MPPPDHTLREVGTVTIVDLRGALMLGISGTLFRQTIQSLIDKQTSKVSLNFLEVTTIDSAGVGELVGAYTTMKSRRIHLKLLNPPRKVRDLLELTQLSKVLEVYTNEELAVRSFD